MTGGGDLVSPDDSRTASRALFTLRTIWGALVLSVGIYGGLAVLLERLRRPAATVVPVPPVMIYALGATAVALTLAIPILRRRLMPPISDVEAPGPLSRAAANTAMGKLLTASILSWALSEAIAVFGLLLTFLGQDLLFVAAFGALAVVNLVIYAPRSELVRGVLQGAAGP